MKWNKGFSLIELMFALAIVGILAAIALPSYQQYLRRGIRADAQTYMLEIAGRQGQFLIDFRAYAATPADLGLTPPPSINEPGNEKYTVSIDPLPAGVPAFTVRAVPQHSQTADNCGTLTLNSAGAKTASGTGTCW